jgi:hypothetical protein
MSPERRVFTYDFNPALSFHSAVAKSVNGCTKVILDTLCIANWLARAPDLNPLDFFLWDFLTSLSIPI